MNQKDKYRQNAWTTEHVYRSKPIDQPTFICKIVDAEIRVI